MILIFLLINMFFYCFRNRGYLHTHYFSNYSQSGLTIKEFDHIYKKGDSKKILQILSTVFIVQKKKNNDL